MNPSVAIARIEGLIEGCKSVPLDEADPMFIEWRTTVIATLNKTQPSGSTIVSAFSSLRFIRTDASSVNAFMRGADGLERDERLTRARDTAIAYLNSAIREIQLEMNVDDAINESAFDPELWEHVSRHVADGNWVAVASQTAIFLEDCVRSWANAPQTLVGANLMGHCFKADGGVFSVSAVPAEQQGWMHLATGFASAVSNVVRHHVPDRPDIKRYAIGALGTASLILTQVRHECGPMSAVEGK